MNNDRSSFIDALWITYNAVAHDVWGDDTPDVDEYVDVVLEHVDVHGGLTRDELARFQALSLAERRELALSVGP